MLLRLQVWNFKNLRDVTVRFGPMSCFVGPNGVGKSNLFDAIQFLRALADKDIQTAAQEVRSPLSGRFGPKDLLWAGGANGDRMAFSADMLVPHQVADDFGRPASPATTLLRYELELQYVAQPTPRLELTRESLVGLKKGDAATHLGFPHSTAFRQSAVTPSRRLGAFISTEKDRDGAVAVKLHQDGGSRGQPIPAGRSPRTVVGGTNANEYPTVLAARREMASWRALHLEPSMMRAPDPIGGISDVDERGGHIAAALDRMQRAEKRPGQILAEAANQLGALVPEIRSLDIDRDEARQQLSVLARMDGCAQPLGPRSLSDGTLRFLALVTMLLDDSASGVLCMEEPENGIHPKSIPAMVDLLRAYAVEASEAIGEENPARQVILNTHSPEVVKQLLPNEVLFVDTVDGPEGRMAIVSPVEGGWRDETPFAKRRRVTDFVEGALPGPEMEQLKLFETSARG